MSIFECAKCGSQFEDCPTILDPPGVMCPECKGTIRGVCHRVSDTAPQLPSPELTWLFTHCRAIGMECKSESGKWEHDIALFTTDLQRKLSDSESIRTAEKKILIDEIEAHTETKRRADIAEVLVSKLTSDLEEAIFARDTYRKGMETAQNGLRYPRYGDTAGLLDTLATVLEYYASAEGEDTRSYIAPHARRAAERIREALGVKL